MDFYKAFVNMTNLQDITQFVKYCDQTGMPDMAIGVLQTFLKKNPQKSVPMNTRSVIHNALGHFLCQVGRPDEGISHFLESLNIDGSETAEFNLYQQVHKLNTPEKWKMLTSALIPLLNQLKHRDRLLFRMIDKMGIYMIIHDIRLCLQNMTCRPLANLLQGTFTNPPAYITEENIKQHVIEFEGALDEALKPVNILEIRKFFEAYPQLVLPKLGYYLLYTGENIRDIHDKMRRLHEEIYPFLKYRAPHTQFQVLQGDGASKKIKIGIISNNIHNAVELNHPVSKMFVRIFDRLDPTRFEVVYYTFNQPYYEPQDKGKTSPSRVNMLVKRGILKEYIQAWHQMIAREEFDMILYPDIGMENDTYHLSIARLAPIQLTTWGHPQSNGTDIDYYITSKVYNNDPARHSGHEKLFYIDGSMFSINKHHAAVLNTRLPREYFQFPEEMNLYMCLQSIFKITPHFDKIVEDILERDPKAVIVFLNSFRDGGDIFKHAFQRRLQSKCGKHIHRILFIDRVLIPSEFFACAKLANCILDSFPFSGGITSLEFFSMGLPIVTLEQPHICGSQTASYYRLMGIPDLITSTVEDYVTKAIELANNRELYEEISEKINGANGVLFDNEDAIRNWEEAFQEIFRLKHYHS